MAWGPKCVAVGLSLLLLVGAAVALGGARSVADDSATSSGSTAAAATTTQARDEYGKPMTAFHDSGPTSSLTQLTGSDVTIGVDNRNALSSGTLLATGADFDMFRQTIALFGWKIRALDSFTSDDLADLNAIILKQPYAIPFSEGDEGEIAAIQAFVADRGGLLFAGEGGGDSSLFVDNVNQLLAPFGVTFAPEAMGADGTVIEDFVNDDFDLTFGLTTIGVDFYREIAITPPTVDLTTSDTNVLAALNGLASDAGNVVVIGDSSLWANSDSGSDYPISFEDNQRLLENILSFIVSVCGDSSIDSNETCDPPNSLVGPYNNPCSASCTYCGDGVVNGEEECEPDPLDDPNACTTECREQDLLVILEDFSAEVSASGTRLRWSTVMEVDTIGFRLLRVTDTAGRSSKRGVEVALHAGLLAPKGSALQGADYEFVDNDRLEAGRYGYYLEDVDVRGAVTRHGPVFVEVDGRPQRRTVPRGRDNDGQP